MMFILVIVLVGIIGVYIYLNYLNKTPTSKSSSSSSSSPARSSSGTGSSSAARSGSGTSSSTGSGTGSSTSSGTSSGTGSSTGSGTGSSTNSGTDSTISAPSPSTIAQTAAIQSDLQSGKISVAQFEAERAKILADQAAQAQQTAILNKQNIQARVCPKDGIPPCNRGFISTTVLDPDSTTGASTTCCLIDPNRNDPTKIQQAISMSKEIAKNLAGGQIIDFAVKIGKQISKGQLKFGQTVLRELSMKLQGKVIGKITTKIASDAGRKVAQQAVQKLGTKIATEIGEKIAIKVGQKAAVKAATMAGKTAVKAGMGPVGWALMGFDILSLGLDLADPGAYNDVTFLSDYKETRDKINETYKNEMIAAGFRVPTTISPLDKMPQEATLENAAANESDVPKTIGDIENFIASEYVMTYASAITETLDLSELSDLERQPVFDAIIADGLAYFETPDGKKYLANRKCLIAGGEVVGEDMCTYKDKASCDASYDWAKIKAAFTDKEAKVDPYVEFRDGQCILVNPTLRSSCEDNGVEYDYDKQLCKITETYCKTKGLDPINTPDGTDCKLKMGQEVAELIFGTTVTRGLKQVFDPNQYKPCKAGEYDGGNVPEPYKTLLYASIALLPPLNIPGILYATLGNKICIVPSGCPEGTENSNGLCYPKCRDGFKSDGATFCYKQYPDWENNGQGHTVTSITKKTMLNTGKPLSSCPSDKDQDAGLCYSRCPDGMYGVGPVCHAHKHGVGIGTAVQLEDCPPNSFSTGLTCMENCGDGYHNVLGVCWR